MEKKSKKGQLGMGIGIILGVVALVILFVVGVPLTKSAITDANLSGTDLTVANAVITLLIVVALAVVVALIVMAFRGK